MQSSLKSEAFPHQPVYIISLGKAAGSMGFALSEWLGESFAEGWAAAHSLDALDDLPRGWERHVGSHPRPSQASLKSGAALLKWIESLPPEAKVWACLSGGSSAIIEAVKPGSSLSLLQDCLDRSFAEGWTIEKLNNERQKHSPLKGGGIARLLGARLERVFCLSDVEPGRLDILGSGPFWLDETKAIHKTIADRSSLIPLVETAAAEFVFCPHYQGSFSMDLEEWISACLQPMVKAAEPGTLCFWIGEPTLRLGPNPPKGGRCHEAALRARTFIKQNQTFAAFGTDGLDGTSGHAGAIVDSSMSLPANLSKVLAEHKALDWCQEVSASIPEKVTGSNLNDIAILITQ